MKTTRANVIGALALMTVPTMMFSSCSVDSNYSLADLNTDMTLLEQISLPVGSTKFIPLSDLLKVNAGEALQTDKNGNYSINYSVADGASVAFDIPGMDLKDLKFTVNDSFSDIPGGGLPVVVEGPITVGTIDKSVSELFDVELPEDVTDVKSIKMTSDYEITIKSTTGTFYLAKGFKLTLPDLFKYSDVQSSEYSVKNGVVEFLKDTKASKGTYSIFLKITGMDLSKTVIGRDKLSGKTTFKTKGDLFVEGADYSEVPSSFLFSISAEMKNAKVTEAEVKLNVSESVSGTNISFNSIPEFLSGADTKLGMEDIVIILNADNNSPLDLKISASIASSKDGAGIGKCSINDIVLPAGKKSKVRISCQQETSSESDVICVYAPDLSSLLASVPDQIQISDIVAKNANEYNTVKLNSKGSVSVGYEMNASLSFASGTHIGYSDTINDLNLNLESVGVKQLSLCFDIINSIPLDLNLDFAVIDAAGNPVSDITSSLSSVVKGGTLESPTTTSEVLRLSSTSPIQKIDGFKITVTADVPSEKLAGIPINANQGIQLSNIVVRIDGGVTLK